VAAAAVHAPIGLRNVIREATPWRGRGLDLAMVLLFFAMLALGLRAVVAVVAP
jgi:fumarate reductase subunit C